MATPKFRPYRGLDEKIKAMPQQPGYVYFATDTGRIYLDYDNERIPMGGNGASLYYANDTDVVKDLLDNYFIDIDTIVDAGSSLKANDLIINGDGAFYRVLEITDEHTAKCTRIAVSGTGGGGGSGDGGGGTGPTQKNITLELIGEFPTTFVYGKKTEVTFKSEALYDTYIRYNIVIQGNNDTKTLNYQAKTGEEFTFDVGSELYQGNNIIVVTAFADNSGEATLKYPYRESIVFALKKNPEFNPKVVQTGTLSFFCIPVGTTQKTLEIYIDGILEDTKTISSSLSDSNYTVDIKAQPHGTHTLQAVLKANVGGADVETDPISYQIAWNDGESTAPLVWFPEGYPESIVQYEDLLIEFMVYHPEKITEIETHFYKEGVELASSPRLLNYDYTTVQKWNITDYEVGSNSYTIRVGATSQPIHVEVEPDENRDLEIRTGGLILNLETSGRSNEENISSRTSWISKNTTVPTAVTFNNFNWYNNGWIEDDDGRSCLRISNGASIKIPVESLGITRNNRMLDYLCYEFRFKPRNVKEYSFLITTEEKINETSGKLETVQTFSSEKGVLGKLFGTSGLCIGTQDAFFKSAQSSVYVKYREDELLTLSIVIDAESETYPLIYIYLNGILSGIALYNKETDNFRIGEDFITMNSDYCDIDLYNIRIYKGKKMYSQNIVHNNIADKKDAKAYDLNKIVEVKNNIPTINFTEMENYNNDHPDETLMPYMIIRSRSADNMLPFVKGGKKPVDITFKNPALDYAYKQGYITLDQYIHGAPSFHFSSKKDSLDVQGTSSQSYPRRNYKWKAKQKDVKWYYTIDDAKLSGMPIYKYDEEASAIKGKDVYVGTEIEGKEYKKYYLDSNIGETTFCLKADYMESSGTHNTGYASFVSALYDKHPLEYYLSGELKDKESIRTTIYGFPILVFQQTDDDSYEFIGRYNFNLDKGATDTCGFTYDDDSKIVDSINEETGEKIYKPFEDIAECWELKNNQGGRCSYTKLDFEETSTSYREVENLTATDFASGVYYIYDPEDQTYKVASEYNESIVYYEIVSGTLDWLNDFEYRYSAFEDDIDNAIEKKDKFSSMSQENVNKFLNEKLSNFIKLASWLNSTNVQDPNVLGTEFKEPKIIDGITYTHDTEKYRLAKFRTEFDQHLNLEYCIIYFIMTELLHLYDSRGKNCMMASWGPTVEDGEYIWFPIFYDIDTQLGINNSGVPTWDYDVEPTKNKEFSTSNSVLWNNLWTCFADSIKTKYGELRLNTSGKGINIFNLDGYYNAYPILDGNALDSWKDILEAKTQDKIISYAKIGKRPPMIINTDQYHKYINPTLVGYTDTSGKTDAKDGGKHFYCLQGDRALSRYQYLRNRLNYVDSLWAQGDGSYVAIQNNFKLRFTANHHSTTSDKYIVSSVPVEGMITTTEEEYPMPLDADVNTSGVLSYLKQYIRCYFDEVPTEAVYCNGVDSVIVNATADLQRSVREIENYSQQLMYYGNPNYIADLGDLSKKYIDEISIGALKRLKRLQLGSDETGYYNNNPFKSISFDFAYDGNGEPLYGLLEEVILTGLSSSSLNIPVNFSGCEKLKTFRALNTQITGISLPNGTTIQTLHLPASITGLKLVEPVAMEKIISNPGNITDGFKEGLYIDKITIESPNYNEIIPFNSYYIEGGRMGYDSYRLLEKLYNFKENVSAPNNRLSINLLNVDWTPFQLVEYGDPYLEENKDYYYRDNDRFGLEAYFGGETYWDSDTLNGKIYLLKEEFRNENGNLAVDKIPITNLEILEQFITTYESALLANNYVLNNYTNGMSNKEFSYPEITGNIYVYNFDSNPYDESIIINRLRKYFPKVNFFFNKVAYAYRSLFVKIDENGKEIIEFTESKSAETSTEQLFVSYPSIVPEIINKDFIGWSKNKDANPTDTGVYYPDMENFETEWSNIKYNSTEEVIKFYAIFDWTKYAMEFYNYNKDGSETELTVEYVEAGSKLYHPNILPSIDESNLPDDMRYQFLGWVNNKDYCYPSTKEEGLNYIINLENIVSENPRKFYACYFEENVLVTPTDTKYFSFIKDTITTSSGTTIGYRCSSKSGIKYKGKITIPATYEGLPIISIDISKQPELTHIYFESPETMLQISSLAENSELKIIDWPSGLKLIMASSLKFLPKLQFNPEKFNNMRLEEIQTQAFIGSFDFSNGPIEVLCLPNSLTKISSQAFANMNQDSVIKGNYMINEVQFGGVGMPWTLDLNSYNLGSNIFNQNELAQAPNDLNATTTTPIRKYTLYKDSTASEPTIDTFKLFLENKCIGDDNLLTGGYEVVDA